MKDIIKPAASLFIITLVAALCLGLVYDITKAPIERQRQNTKTEAMQKLIPKASSFEPFETAGRDESIIVSLYAGLDEAGIVGYIIGVSPGGYSGRIDMVVGIDAGGVIAGVKILRQTETPGLGARATDEEFIGQFREKSGLFSAVKNPSRDNEIQAITAATITSRAVTQGVNDAMEFFEHHLRGAGLR